MNFGGCETVGDGPFVVLDGERGRKLTIVNPTRLRVRKVKVDGCVHDPCLWSEKQRDPKAKAPPGERRCDHLALVDAHPGQPLACFVELKGSDTRHAISQVVETVRAFRACAPDEMRRYRCIGVIVTRGVVQSYLQALRAAARDLPIDFRNNGELTIPC